MSPEAVEVIEKIRLMLETKGCTEAEAQSRTALAMKLLAKHNLDMAAVRDRPDDLKRHDVAKSGGLYQWQRDLWKSVSKLNFCVYISIKGLTKGSKYQNRVIGRQENVASTEVMAGYLQDTIERLAQEWAKGEGINVFCKEAIAYREGMADRLCERLRDVREERLAEDAAKARQEETRARHPGSTPGTALVVLSSVISAEDDLNTDYLRGYPPGTTARRREEEQRRREEDRMAREKWERENPEAYQAKLKLQAEWWAKAEAEYQKKEAARRRRAEREGRDPDASRYRAATPREERATMGSYYRGREKAEGVGLDRQIGDEGDKRKLV